MNPFIRHEKAMLLFSGGKDSIALLDVMRPYIDRIVVLWVNPGAALPETIKQMEKVRDSVPDFRVLHGNQPADVERNGFPSDIVPVEYSIDRAIVEGSKEFLVRPWHQCCSTNLWQVLLDGMQKIKSSEGISLVIRGQKNADPVVPKARSGEIHGGFEIWHPLESWTDEEVYAYVSEKGLELPESYQHFGSSLDCWSCTAHVKDNAGKIGYLEKFHPEKATELRRRVSLIHEAAKAQMAHFDKFMGQ